LRVVFMATTIRPSCVSGHHPLSISRRTIALAAPHATPDVCHPEGGEVGMGSTKHIEGVTEPTGGPDAVVLETKLTPPRVRSEHIQRQALFAALRAGSAQKLTLVAAPPGFGKSTLLAEWAAAQPQSTVAWLSLDETDNDPARFFTYLAAAVRH